MEETRSSHHRGRRVGTTMALVLVAPVAIGLLGELYWGFDLVANFRPHAGVVLLMIAVIWWRFDPESASIVAFAGVIGVTAVAPAFAGSDPAPQGPVVDVMTFNVGVSNPRRPDVADFIADIEPDLVYLFESSFEWEAAMERADLPLVLVRAVPTGRVAGVSVFASPDLDPAAIEVDVGGESAAISIVVGDERVDVIGVHPPSPTSAVRADRRDRMLTATGDWVAARPRPVIVVGDFNATPWSAAHRSLRWRGMLVDSLRGAGLQASWPDGWGALAIPIDHVLHTAQLASTDRRTGPSFGSAHRPVLVSIGFRR
jgi:endonuclease/exonuclease/phosphatase (EEP) superfamily protein YafD